MRKSHPHPYSILLLTLFSLSACSQAPIDSTAVERSSTSTEAAEQTFGQRLSDAAIELTKDAVTYDPSYFSIDYPGGDVPSNVGVCTDVVIRAYRTLDIDLQELVHLDMRENFELYPKIWGLRSPDTNIDHRRVPNLMVFFERHGMSLPLSDDAADYLPGDVVCWNLSGGITHTGIVIDKNSVSGRPLIVHNIGAGQEVQDCLFEYILIGHYRFEK